MIDCSTLAGAMFIWNIVGTDFCGELGNCSWIAQLQLIFDILHETATLAGDICRLSASSRGE